MSTIPDRMRGSAEIYRLLFDEAGDILFAADERGTLLEVNRQAEDLGSRGRSELIGHRIFAFVVSADRRRALSDFRRALAGEQIHGEYRLATTYGEVWFRVVARVVRLGGGGVIVHGIANDIQARRDLEAQLERHNSELQSLLDACTAIGARRSIDELNRAIAFEAFRLAGQRAAITVYASRSAGEAIGVVAYAGKSTRVEVPTGLGPGGRDRVDELVQRAIDEASVLWVSDNAGIVTRAGKTVTSCSALPLCSGDRVLGCILAETVAEDVLDNEAVALLRAFAERAAAALDNLSLSEARLRLADEQSAIVEHLGDGVLVIDPAHQILACNPAAEQMIASWSLVQGDGIVGPDRWSMSRLDGTPLPRAELPSVVTLEEGRSVAHQSLILKTSDTDRVITMSSEPLRRPDDSVRAATLVFRDITRQMALMTELERRAEDLCREKDAFRRYAQALSQFEDAVIITSPTGRIEEWLGGAEKLIGRSAAEVLGQPIEAIVSPSERAKVAAQIEAALSSGAGWSSEVSLSPADGRALTALLTVSTVQDETGLVVARAYVAKDVTEQKRFRDSLARTQRMEGLGTLAGGVAHEINNPLAVLSMNLTSLRGLEAQVRSLAGSAGAAGPLDGIRELVDESAAAAARIATVVNTLQSFSRARSEEAAEVAVPQVLDSAVAVAQNEIRHRAVLRKEYGPAPAVHANRQELEQAFLNVLVNACQAIREGRVETNSITLRIGQGAPTSDGGAGWVKVEIEDTGSGIDEEIRAHVFDPFVTTKEAGGLGLAITHEVVTKLGGRIDIDSAVDRGTKVTFWLPAAPGASAARAPRAAEDGKDGRLLVVEDEPFLRKAYRRILCQRFDVVDVGTGEEALSLLRGDRFDLVLCDLQMPGMSGVDLYERCVADGTCPSDRFLFITGGAFTPHVKRFAEEHSDRCLLKPVDVGALVARLERELAGLRAR
ncbi:MAG: PAS domain S-box protein [Deltaproteobacteria bacterium]|nr:PAS domain S-box protein [Deltaproteobacteria bacterium]